MGHFCAGNYTTPNCTLCLEFSQEMHIHTQPQRAKCCRAESRPAVGQALHGCAALYGFGPDTTGSTTKRQKGHKLIQLVPHGAVWPQALYCLCTPCHQAQDPPTQVYALFWGWMRTVLCTHHDTVQDLRPLYLRTRTHAHAHTSLVDIAAHETRSVQCMPASVLPKLAAAA